MSFWLDTWAAVPLLRTSRYNGQPRPRISLRDALPLVDTLLPRPRPQAIDAIARTLPALLPNTIDECIWRWDPSGVYSSKSLYKIMVAAGKIRLPRYQLLWKARVPPAAKVFFLLLMRNKLRTQDNLLKRGFDIQGGCALCPFTRVETALHLFSDCPFIREVANFVGLQTPLIMPGTDCWYNWSSHIPASKTQRHRWMVSTILLLWGIWRERNNRVFRNRRCIPRVMANALQVDIERCIKHCGRSTAT